MGDVRRYCFEIYDYLHSVNCIKCFVREIYIVYIIMEINWI